MTDARRLAFEAWCRLSGRFTDWSKTGGQSTGVEYQVPRVQVAWEAWQAASGTPNPIPYGWTHSRTYWVEVGPHAQEIVEGSAKELGEGCEAFPLYAMPVNSEGA